ncbi:MAG: oligosaccharide flippase family protein [Planctomycetota bacterium]
MNPASGDLRHRTVHSLFWQLLGVGGQRIVQLASPIVLSRLIPAEEIGLFGIVLAGIGAIEALTKFMGEETTIWSQRGAERRYLDTVFTVHVLRGLCITALLCAVAHPLAWFFSDPDTDARYWVPGLFLALAGNGLVDGLSSPARAIQLKGLAFRRVATGDFCAVLLGTSLTIVLAFTLRSVWAMLLGYLGTTVLRTAISYIVAPHRPRLHIDREVCRELFTYGRGAAGAPFLLLMIFTAPAFVLGKIAGKGAVAVFDFAGRLAKLPEDIFLRVLGPVAVPAYAQLKHDRPRLARAWLGAVRTFLLVGMPMTASLAWCGDALPTVVFGEHYGSIAGLFALLALHGGLAGLTAVVGPLFWAVGEPKWDRKAQFFRCLTIYALGIPAAIWGGTTAFAGAACIAIGVALAFSLAHALPILGLRLRDLTHAMRDGLWLGCALAACMLLVDIAWSPAGIWRVTAAGAIGGPVIAFLVFRLLRDRGKGPIAAVPAEATAMADQLL